MIETNDQVARKVDNYVYYLGKIAKHKYPNIKPWQIAIVTHAKRGLINTFNYEDARGYYHKVTKNNK